MSINKVILIGRLGKDPEVRNTPNAKVASFSVATSETFKDKSGQKKENTEWHNVVAWRGLADIAEKYLRKGDQVYIEGRLKTRSWESNGQTKYITEVLVDQLVMLGSKRSEARPEVSNDEIPWQ